MKRAGRKTAFCVLPSERGLGQGASAFSHRWSLFTMQRRWANRWRNRVMSFFFRCCRNSNGGSVFA
jgi:hypothetical protein